MDGKDVEGDGEEYCEVFKVSLKEEKSGVEGVGQWEEKWEGKEGDEG